MRRLVYQRRIELTQNRVAAVTAKKRNECNNNNNNYSVSTEILQRGRFPRAFTTNDQQDEDAVEKLVL
jgi:hypothetical protein